jgi:hypothetical protein
MTLLVPYRYPASVLSKKKTPKGIRARERPIPNKEHEEKKIPEMSIEYEPTRLESEGSIRKEMSEPIWLNPIKRLICSRLMEQAVRISSPNPPNKLVLNANAITCTKRRFLLTMNRQYHSEARKYRALPPFSKRCERGRLQ